MTAQQASVRLEELAELLDRDAMARIQAMHGRELYIPFPQAVAGSSLGQLIGPAATKLLARRFPDHVVRVRSR